MKKDNRIYLVHMLETAERVARRIVGATRVQFDANEDLQLALTHLLQVIGEAARLVSPETRSYLPGVPWRDITGMRHRLVHDYLNIDFNTVWNVSERDIPPLIEQLNAALQIVGDPRFEPDP